jgi:hypothetical protein
VGTGDSPVPLHRNSRSAYVTLGSHPDCANRSRLLESMKADVAQLVEQPIGNLQILPHYQRPTLMRARQMRVSAPVFVRAAVES